MSDKNIHDKLASTSNKKISFISLGCPKNTVDTEIMLGLINKQGHELTNEEDSEIVIINTCSFIEAAQKESIEAIIEMGHKGKEVIVTGCMAQDYKKDLLDEIPEVKAVVGSSDFAKINTIIDKVSIGERTIAVSNNLDYLYTENTPRILIGSTHTAYVKISEGCDHPCTFCHIPALRGRHRSRTIESITAEVQALSEMGVKEAVIVAQDTTSYGIDIYGKPQLAELLKSLVKTDISWIRVMYAFPSMLNDNILETIASEPKVMKYLDMPLQHSHHDILRAMKRPADEDFVEARLEKVRKLIPGVSIRSAFIVGFPGETDKHFAHLIDFVKRQRFDKIGVFEYSQMDKTPSAHYDNQVDNQIKAERKDILMAVAQPISLENNNKLLGSELTVLIDSYDTNKDTYMGRSYREAPDVDGSILLKSKRELNIGDFVTAKITRASAYDLRGRVL